MGRKVWVIYADINWVKTLLSLSSHLYGILPSFSLCDLEIWFLLWFLSYTMILMLQWCLTWEIRKHLIWHPVSHHQHDLDLLLWLVLLPCHCNFFARFSCLLESCLVLFLSLYHLLSLSLSCLVRKLLWILLYFFLLLLLSLCLCSTRMNGRRVEHVFSFSLLLFLVLISCFLYILCLLVDKKTIFLFL